MLFQWETHNSIARISFAVLAMLRNPTRQWIWFGFRHSEVMSSLSIPMSGTKPTMARWFKSHWIVWRRTSEIFLTICAYSGCKAREKCKEDWINFLERRMNLLFGRSRMIHNQLMKMSNKVLTKRLGMKMWARIINRKIKTK